jgi:hypothetical protein
MKTPEEINKIIAEECGWSCHTIDDVTFWWNEEVNKTLPPDDDGFRECPDYYHDLNACHEMESQLSHDQQTKMNEILACVVVPPNQRIWRATAPQRCEAFLKTTGKWKD